MALTAPCSLPFYNLRQGNAVIKREVIEGNTAQAILTYVRMQEMGVCGDNFTFPILLKAASDLSSSPRVVGAAFHGQAMKTGYATHTFVQTALVNMYSAFGELGNARYVFDDMPRKDPVAWNSMLKAYAFRGRMDDAAKLFDLMPLKDQVSFNTMISGYANIGMIGFAQQIFGRTPARDVVSWNSMISAHIKVGDIESACSLFDAMPERNAVSWNTLLAGYLRSHHYVEVVELFNEMKAEGLEPNDLIAASVLSACAHMGSLDTGKEIHILTGEIGLTMNPHVAASLIDMYAKCGSIERALEVFFKVRDKDIFCWNAMISGLAFHGYGEACVKLFDDMRNRGMKPDDITFIGLLSACSHAGLVSEGRRLFKSMEKEHGITPKLEHYGCMVDLLARAGHLKHAYEIVETMPFEPGEAVLGALLGACTIHESREIGKAAVNLIVARTDHLSDAEYMMLANLFATCGRWEEASRWREMMNNDRGVTKTAGWSGVEIGGRMHRFLAGDVRYQH